MCQRRPPLSHSDSNSNSDILPRPPPPRHLLNKRTPESVVVGFWNPSRTQELCWVVPCTAGFHTREGRATQLVVRRGGSAPSRLNFLESPKLSLSS